MEDRVRRSTSPVLNKELDRKLKQSVESYIGKDRAQISLRIEELEKEWDIERALGVNMSSLALTGIALTAFHHKRWLILPAVVVAFFAQHAIQGWCPPLPILRRLGYRTTAEIDQEKYALKVLRGDFKEVGNSDNTHQSADLVVKAVL
jgi:hypothetical protein